MSNSGGQNVKLYHVTVAQLTPTNHIFASSSLRSRNNSSLDPILNHISQSKPSYTISLRYGKDKGHP